MNTNAEEKYLNGLNTFIKTSYVQGTWIAKAENLEELAFSCKSREEAIFSLLEEINSNHNNEDNRI